MRGSGITAEATDHVGVETRSWRRGERRRGAAGYGTVGSLPSTTYEVLRAVGEGGGKSTQESLERLARYQEALASINAAAHAPSSGRGWLVWTIALVVVLAIVVVVGAYRATTDEAAQVPLKEICNLENINDCILGLRKQLKNSTTAALRAPAHYLFTFSAILVTVLIFAASQRRRERKHSRLLESLPGDEVDLWHARRGPSRPLQTMPFNVDVYRTIQEYLCKAVILKNVQQLIVENTVSQSEESRRDLNWGYVDLSELAGSSKAKLGSKVNYKLNTAESFEYISVIAGRHDPELEITPWETVREYVTRLKKTCSGPEYAHRPIQPHKCDEFIELYEEAKFHNADFNSERWEQVRQSLLYFHTYFS